MEFLLVVTRDHLGILLVGTSEFYRRALVLAYRPAAVQLRPEWPMWAPWALPPDAATCAVGISAITA